MFTSLESYNETASQIVADSARAFHIEAPAADGNVLLAPACFRMASENPAAFRAGKASPQALREAAALLIGASPPSNREELQELILRNELGTDCSNFVYHTQAALHGQTLGIEYASTVHRDATEVARLAAAKQSWSAPAEALEALNSTSNVSAEWIARTFHKQPQFVIGATHITAPQAVEHIATDAVLPGDIVALKGIGSSATCHVGVVASVAPPDAASEAHRLQMWHSLWQEDPSQGGVRLDEITIAPDGSHEFSWCPNAHQRLEPHFMRPAALARITAGLFDLQLT